MKTHFYTTYITQICDNQHLSVDEIFIKVSQEFLEAGKSSIYRNVEELVKKWVLKKVTGIWKKAYFEKAKTPHAHLIDEKSWEITDIEFKNLDKIFLKNIPNNFSVSNMDIKIFGKFT